MVVEHLGTAVAGDDTLVFRPKHMRAGLPCVVYAHALGGSGQGLLALEYGQRELADLYGIPTISTDLAGDGWGSDTVQSRIDSCLAYMASRYGCDTDPFGMIAMSMGNYALFNYMANNAGKIAAAVSIIANVDLATKYADAAFTASINAAYGGDATASIAGHNPWARQAAITTGRAGAPIKAWYSSDDPYETVAKLQEFFTGIGGVEEHNMGAIGHSGAGVSASAAAALIASALA